MLMSDLSLKLEWAEAGKKAKRKNANNKRKKKAADEDEAAFHFIAYVPMGTDVWELNGMQEKPLKLGESKYAVKWRTLCVSLVDLCRLL